MGINIKMKRKFQYYIYKILDIIFGFFQHCISFVIFLYWGVNFNKTIKLYGIIRIRNLNKITIGSNTRIISGTRNVVGLSTRTFFETGQNGNIIIGSNVGMSNCILVSQESIIIEDFVYIGGGVKIYDNDFHSLNFNQRIYNPTLIPKSSILIKYGSFIGAHSIILKGVVVGRMAVVGAGSVVTKSIPDNEIWAGIPAKKIGVVK
jgi:acetyltransferase-like isoleucine patch superfamily enzyme